MANGGLASASAAAAPSAARAPATARPASPGRAASSRERLAELGALLDEGLITKAEYEGKRKAIIEAI